MKVRELQQELLNMDPDLEVLVPVPNDEDMTYDFEPAHSWDYQHDDEGDRSGVILWPRY